MASNLSYLSEYQTFQDKQELNHHVKQHIDATDDDINATDRSIFKFIARHSVKYAGASHLKVSTIAESVGKSVSTVKRSLKRLESLVMLKRIECMRKKSGGNGANIIQILPYKDDQTNDRIGDRINHRTEGETPTEATDKPAKSKKEPLYKQFLSSSNTLSDTIYKHARSLRQSIPQVIYDALAPFCDAEGLYKTYGLLIKAKATVDRNITVEEHGESYVDVFLNAIRKHNLGKIRKLDGYLFKAWQQLTAQIKEGLTTEAPTPKLQPRRQAVPNVVPDWFKERKEKEQARKNDKQAEHIDYKAEIEKLLASREDWLTTLT